MPLLLISEVGRQIGLAPSAIRYYEQIGILPAPQRTSGQRRYEPAVLHRLAIVQLARQAGFTLEEIRELFSGFRDRTPASRRWRQLSQRKLAELDAKMGEIKTMRRLLRGMIHKCCCETLDQCGRGIFKDNCSHAKQKRRPGTQVLRGNQKRQGT